MAKRMSELERRIAADYKERAVRKEMEKAELAADEAAFREREKERRGRRTARLRA